MPPCAKELHPERSASTASTRGYPGSLETDKEGMTKETFLDSAKRCCENGCRLLDEAQLLEFEQPSATRYYLSMIAQEEAAKAFLLYLVAIEALPWTPFLLRATRDHQCKQLAGIVLDYISPDTDEFLRRMDMCVLAKRKLQLPSSVADAMNLLCHEKIRGSKSRLWVWAEDPEYAKAASRGGRRQARQRQAACLVCGSRQERTGQCSS